MSIQIIEFKARVTNLQELESRLQQLNPDFKGEDHQIDTYFNVSKGRLKLREGNIEHALIYYEREDIASSKLSNVILYPHKPDSALKQILQKLHGIKVIVEKYRRIYYVDHLKFHFDRVESLGTFVEVEAIDRKGEMRRDVLKAQCNEYLAFFNIEPSNLVARSYSDLLLSQMESPV